MLFGREAFLGFRVVALTTDFNPELASLLTVGFLNLQVIAIIVSKVAPGQSEIGR